MFYDDDDDDDDFDSLHERFNIAHTDAQKT